MGVGYNKISWLYLNLVIEKTCTLKKKKMYPKCMHVQVVYKTSPCLLIFFIYILSCLVYVLICPK